MKLFQLFESKELNSELIWFQRYITDHDFETQMEIEDDKIVFHVGGKLIEWDVDEARRIRTNVITDANQSYKYALDVIEGRFELGEPAISSDIWCSYMYALDIFDGRFELGEPVIAQDPKYSVWYARDVIKRRFELGEPAIIKSGEYSYFYARDVIKERWKFGEPAISEDSEYSKYYQEFLKSLK